MKKIVWGTMIPLIGGMTIGNEQAIGTKPSFILSYAPFSSNDSHCINHYKDSTPFYLMEDLDKNFIKNQFGLIDIISSVCPCSGLSSATTRTHDRNDSPQNEWMYRSTTDVLSIIKPKVLWGENAPALFSSTITVSNRLAEIGAKHGYSFSMYKTNTILHGIPQARPRTFYFFWKDSTAPIFDSFNRERTTLKEYLAETPQTEYSNVYPTNKSLKDDVFYSWCKKNEPEKLATYSNTILKFMLKYDLFNRFLIDTNDPNGIRVVNHIQNKLSMGKNFRDGSVILYNEKDYIGAVHGATITSSVHPTEERFMSIAEIMHLMGMPADFKLMNSTYTQIGQNVPVCTAKDMTNQVVKFLNGELKDSGQKFFKQDNTLKDQKIVHHGSSLEDFF